MKILNEVISNLETYRGVDYINREELIKSLKLAKEEINKQLSIHGVSNCTLCNTEINYKGVCEMCYTEQKLNDID